MSIASIVLGGFGNGTVSGSIALVVTRGYVSGEDLSVDPPAGVYRPRAIAPTTEYRPRSVEPTGEYRPRIPRNEVN